MSTTDLSSILKTKPWGAEFLREMDLTIAANVLASAQVKETLYNAVINDRVAHRCRELDREVVDDFRGTVRITPNVQDPWRAVPDATAFLQGTPRGTWAIFELEGKYEAYMSDGEGKLAATDGNLFMYTKPTAPDLSFDSLYAQVIGSTVYYRRKAIEAEIKAFSAATNMPIVDEIREDVYVQSKKWAKIRFLGLDPEARDERIPYQIEATRPGVRRVKMATDANGIHSLFGKPYVQVPSYEDPANEERLRTLHERRIAAAKVACARIETETTNADARQNGHASHYFRANGDEYTRQFYFAGDEDLKASGSIRIEFAPGSDDIVVAELREKDVAQRFGR